MSEWAAKEIYPRLYANFGGSHHGAQLLHTQLCASLSWVTVPNFDLRSTPPLGGWMSSSPVSLETLWTNFMYVPQALLVNHGIERSEGTGLIDA